MKKILPFLLCLLMSVTAMAGETYTFEDTYRYNGNVTHSGDGAGKVVITDNGDGTYNVSISGIFIHVDLGTTTFKNVPGTTKNGYTKLSSNMEFLEGEVEGSGFNRGATKMTVEGAFKGDECYLYLAGTFQGWSDNPFEIWFGTELEPDAIVYKVKAAVTYGDDTVMHNDDENRITDNGDGTMKFTYMKFTIAESNILVGDYTIYDIAVSDADNEGFKSFSSNGPAKVTNLGAFSANSGISSELDIPASVSGRFNDTDLEATGEWMVSGSGTAPHAKFSISTTETAISAVEASNAAVEGIYSATGVKYNKLQKGLNIVRKGGKTFKVMGK